MVLHIRITPHQLNDPHKSLEESLVPAIVERINILLDFRQFHEINYGLRRLNYLLLDVRTSHVQKPRQHTVSNQFLVAHDLRAVESGNDLDE